MWADGELASRLEPCSSAALMVQAAEQDMVAALTNLDSLGNAHHDGSMEPPCSLSPRFARLLLYHCALPQVHVHVVQQYYAALRPL